MRQTNSEYLIDDDDRILEVIPEERPADSVHSALMAPMKIENDVVGVMQVQSYQLDAYAPDDMELLSSLANVVAIALQNARLYRQAQEELAQRERLEDQLRQAAKMEAVGQLAGGVAHDFDNLLTVINGYSQLSLELTEPGTDLHQNLADILAAGERAANLTRQLLIFSRRQTFDMRVMDLNDTLQSLGKILRRLIGENIVLEMRPANRLDAILADSGQMEQVIVNLVVNARDAIHERGQPDGRIVLETAAVTLDRAFVARHPDAQPGAHVRLSVRDNGCGIPPEIIERIFEPFFTTKEPGVGTGLGLSTVYGIVKQLGGAVDIQSEAGQGTTFDIYLPQHKAETQPQHTDEAYLQGGGETILVVEDEDAVRQLAVAGLRALGYTVLAASNAAQALDLCQTRAQEIDLLLIDVILPAMSGPALAQELWERGCRARVLLMSGYAEATLERQLGNMPYLPLIPTPFKQQELAHRVRQVLDSGIQVPGAQ